MKTTVIYKSNTGTTKKYGEEIGNYLNAKGYETALMSVENVNHDLLKESDHIFIGTPVKGFYFINQGPDKQWQQFANELPNLENAQVHLFTTYSVARGGFFRKMKQRLRNKTDNVKLLFKSHNGTLSDYDKRLLDAFVA